MNKEQIKNLFAKGQTEEAALFFADEGYSLTREGVYRKIIEEKMNCAQIFRKFIEVSNILAPDNSNNFENWIEVKKFTRTFIPKDITDVDSSEWVSSVSQYFEAPENMETHEKAKYKKFIFCKFWEASNLIVEDEQKAVIGWLTVLHFCV